MIIFPPTGSTAKEQEDGRQEHGSPGAPGKTECVTTDAGRETGIPESVAGFDEDGAVDRYIRGGLCVGKVMGAYVIRAAARVNQKRAKPRVKPENPDARRLHGASSAKKNAQTVKARPIR
jgi:hypothetical protein